MKTLICHLNFISPLHIDSLGTGFYQETDSFIRSDTLSAALLSTWLRLFPEDAEGQDREQAIKQNILDKFCLSSAFPKITISDAEKKKEIFYFLPRAASTLAFQVKNTSSTKRKDMKKIKWIESSLYFESLQEKFWQNVFEEKEEEKKKSFPSTLASEFIIPPYKKSEIIFPEAFKAWQKSDNTRVSINRLSSQAAKGQLFEFARLFYADSQRGDKVFKTGLYFLVRLPENDETTQKKFKAVLDLLGDSGIGGDRSSGHGLFEAEMMPSTLNLEAAKPDQMAIGLSLCVPSDDECKLFFEDEKDQFTAHAAYELIKRGGWIAGSGHRKQTLRMFEEGCYFHKPLAGKIVDVTNNNDYPAVRDARGFFIGVPK